MSDIEKNESAASYVNYSEQRLQNEDSFLKKYKEGEDNSPD